MDAFAAIGIAGPMHSMYICYAYGICICYIQKQLYILTYILIMYIHCIFTYSIHVVYTQLIVYIYCMIYSIVYMVVIILGVTLPPAGGRQHLHTEVSLV